MTLSIREKPSDKKNLYILPFEATDLNRNAKEGVKWALRMDNKKTRAVNVRSYLELLISVEIW